MGVEGFRRLSQDKELGCSGKFLLFVSLSFYHYVFSHPKGLIYNLLLLQSAAVGNKKKVPNPCSSAFRKMHL